MTKHQSHKQKQLRKAFVSKRLLLESLEARYLCAVGVAEPGTAALGPTVPSAVGKPNVVLFNLDDMRADALPFMPNVNQLLASDGTNFTNSFVPTGLSGPSRQSLLTGLYANNTGEHSNEVSLGGEINRDYSSTFAHWFQDAGYKTTMFGKIGTNESSDSNPKAVSRPAEWDNYIVHVGALPGGNPYYSFTDFRGSNDGNDSNDKIVSHPGQYSTDVWASDAIDIINNTDTAANPFFIYFAPVAPHSPFIPAARHLDALKDVTPNRPPSFNIAPDYITRTTAGPDLITNMDLARERYLETLLAVDDAVKGMYDALVAKGVLDNTIIVFTGDNGYNWGEHALFDLKHNLTEESLRVPLVIRDGRAPVQRSSDNLALNIDLGVTVASMAGVTVPNAIDGRSLAGIVTGSDNSPTRDAFLIQEEWTDIYRFPREGFGYGGIGVRTNSFKYVEYDSGIKELFDEVNDPFELVNQANNPLFADTKTLLKQRLEQLRSPDRTGPQITYFPPVSYVADADGLPTILVRGQESDVATGGSAVRSPEYFIDHVASHGSGTPLFADDGGYDSVTENFSRNIQLSKIDTLTAGWHQINVHGRDTQPNWSQMRSRAFELKAAPKLTGTAKVIDGEIPVVQTQRTLRGTVAPNVPVKLYGVNEASEVKLLGTFTANATGAWSRVLDIQNDLKFGLWHIMAVEMSPTVANQIVNISAAISLHILVEHTAADTFIVHGTPGNDAITLREDAAGANVAVNVNGIYVGSTPVVANMGMEGGAGNDTLGYVGAHGVTLDGGAGNDILNGGSGNDVLIGGPGINRLRGKLGDDRYVFEDATLILKVAIQRVVNYVYENAGEGNDTLDFSTTKGALNVSTNFDDPANSTLATFNRSSLNILQSVVRGAVGAASFENVVRPPAAPVATAAKLLSSSVPLSAGLLTALGDNDLVRIRFSTTAGTLVLNTQVPGGITTGQAPGNRSQQIEIRATVAAIRTTFAANGLVLQRDAKATSSLNVLEELLSADGLTTLKKGTVSLNA